MKGTNSMPSSHFFGNGSRNTFMIVTGRFVVFGESVLEGAPKTQPRSFVRFSLPVYIADIMIWYCNRPGSVNRRIKDGYLDRPAQIFVPKMYS